LAARLAGDSPSRTSSVVTTANPVQNSIAHGRRVAVRTVIFQLCAMGLVGLGFCAGGWQSGLAAGCGGGVIVIGNALFAWRLFADGVTSSRRAARAVYAAEVLKWFWLAFALYFAIAVVHLASLPLIVGVIAAQLAFWVAVGFIR
jgi:F0F1-type ATP synthase assembly protein I